MVTHWQGIEPADPRSLGLPAKLLNWLQAVVNTAARMVCHAMKADHITPVLKDYTGYESRKESSTSYVSLHLSVSIVWHHPTCPTNFNKSLAWNPDSVWDHRVCQRSSYHLLEGCHWVTEHFLSLPPVRGTVCHQQSLLRQPCIHSVEPWKLIYSSILARAVACIAWCTSIPYGAGSS